MATESIKPMGIIIDDGRRRVPITNNYGDEVGVFYFNPTDINMIERYKKLAQSFDYIIEPLEKVPDSDDDKTPTDDGLPENALNEAKERLYSAVNELFGGDMASAFFGSINPFSPVDGKFYCEIAIEAVGKYISEQFKKETAKINNRVEKYTAKYTKGK